MFTEETQRTVDGLRIIDDTLFRLLASDPEVCQEILRTLLDNDGLKVLQVTPQSTITSLHREIILDALCEIDGGLVNIEVQKGDGNDDIRRTRYHLSSITANSIPKGTDFTNVPNVTVVYITEYDALNNGQVFTVSEMCVKTKDGYVPVHDGARICYVNTAVKDDSDKSELMQLFLKREPFDNARFPKLSSKVKYFKETQKGREIMCELVENYAKEYAEEYAKEAIIEVARTMLDKGDDVAFVAERTKLSLEEVLKIKNEMKQ